MVMNIIKGEMYIPGKRATRELRKHAKLSISLSVACGAGPSQRRASGWPIPPRLQLGDCYLKGRWRGGKASDSTFKDTSSNPARSGTRKTFFWVKNIVLTRCRYACPTPVCVYIIYIYARKLKNGHVRTLKILVVHVRVPWKTETRQDP